MNNARDLDLARKAGSAAGQLMGAHFNARSAMLQAFAERYTPDAISQAQTALDDLENAHDAYQLAERDLLASYEIANARKAGNREN